MSQPTRRIEDRTSVMLRARLRGAGAEREACIVDLSSRGLAATADRPPRQGERVELVVGDIVLVGQVKWTSMRRFGMQFRERISVDGLLSGGDEAARPAAVERADGQSDRDVSSPFTKAETLMLIAGGAIGTRIVVQFVSHSLF